LPKEVEGGRKKRGGGGNGNVSINSGRVSLVGMRRDRWPAIIGKKNHPKKSREKRKGEGKKKKV